MKFDSVKKKLNIALRVSYQQKAMTSAETICRGAELMNISRSYTLPLFNVIKRWPWTIDFLPCLGLGCTRLWAVKWRHIKLKRSNREESRELLIEFFIQTIVIRESDVQCNNVKNSINCTNFLDRRHKKAKTKTKTKKKVLPDLCSSVRMCRSSWLTSRTSRQWQQLKEAEKWERDKWEWCMCSIIVKPILLMSFQYYDSVTLYFKSYR